ncbi:hypothetical protein FGF1_08660 [Flavobacteriaceae bacterium GF1]
MKFISTNKKEIVIGIIAGLIVFFLSPLLNFVGQKLLELFLKLNDAFSEAYYTDIARNNESRFSDGNNLILIFFMVMLCLAIFFLLLEMLDRRKKLIEDAMETLDGPKRPTEEELNARKTRLRKAVERYHSTKKRYRIFSWGMGIILILLSISMISSHFVIQSVAKENLEFQNDLNKIHPYITDENLLLLKSNWANIKNENDFDKVKKQVDSIKSGIKSGIVNLK